MKWTSLSRLAVLGAFMSSSSVADNAPGVKPVPVRAADVATLPHPGTTVPGAIGFTPDSRTVTYLKSETNSLSRVFWRARRSGPKSAPRCRPGRRTGATRT